MHPNACYQTNMKILSGASGGPVFNSAGNVIGVNSTSFTVDPPYTSFISSIVGAFNIIVEGVMPYAYKEKWTIEELCNLGHVIG